jgi:hypothetical protein
MTRHALLALCLVAGCGPGLPDLDRAMTPEGRAMGYPALLPVGPLLAAAEGGTLEPELAQAVAGRAEALRRRARALQGPVIEPPTRRRLAAALARHPH